MKAENVTLPSIVSLRELFRFENRFVFRKAEGLSSPFGPDRMLGAGENAPTSVNAAPQRGQQHFIR
jgi:hypothetical protein